MNMVQFARQCVSDSHRYFPNLMARSLRQKIVHHALGLGGEVGEVLEVVKKWDRGSIDANELQDRVGEELVDVLIYMGNLAGLLDIDLETLYNSKREFNNSRKKEGSDGQW